MVTLGASDDASAVSVIDWARGARFGVGNAGIALSKLGAVETSTPAVLTKPELPPWYLFADAGQRAKVDAFIAANANRVNLALFGSRDGFVHAIYTMPDDVNNTKNGKEAWGFVPPIVAAGLVPDYSNSLSGTLVSSSYPDGSVTLAESGTPFAEIAESGELEVRMLGV